MCGQIGHTILERSGDSHIVERRFFSKVATYTISGQADLILKGNEAELIDYKFCSVWTTREGIKPEWIHQANVLRYLASEDDNPVNITKASVITIYRDWSKPKAAREKDYPKSQVAVFPVALWPLNQTEQYICQRIAAHIMAKVSLPLCTDEERWHSPDKWAVLKKGNKRAHRLLDNEEQANAMAALENMVVEFRAGESKRCEHYCVASQFCEQFKQEKAKQ